MIPKPNEHTVSLFVANKPGVLLRVCLVFSRRRFNIDSLVVSPAFDGKFSRMTIGASGEKDTLEQIIKQCNKLIDVVHASEHKPKNTVAVEVALIKLKASDTNRQLILQAVAHFKGKTIDFGPNSLIVQVQGNSEKIDTCIEYLQKYGIMELVRSGKLVMARGNKET